MELPAFITSLEQAAPGVRIEPGSSIDSQPAIYVEAADALRVFTVLHDAPAFGFDVLMELTAADYLPREPRYELVYLLVSIAGGQRLRVKVRLPAAAPHVPTVSTIWPAANWLEREVWDMFGIAFDGHPDPRRLLMPEDWDGYPLRKDFPVQINMKPHTTEPVQVTEEEFRATLQRDRLSRQ